MAAAAGLTAVVSTVSSAPLNTTVRIPASSRNASFPCIKNRRMRGVCIRAAAQDVDISKVVPQADRVLVRLEDLPEKSAGGVLLPKAAVKFERYLMGEVISVGSEAEAGVVEKGKKVIFSDINAYEVSLGTRERHCFCRVGDLMAVVE
ncbi:hypothetical protein SUGI_0173630 [Cryptomeria japonica]|uniref:10 kDa chaperonin 1, chloroplastic n=1 Tax=Cryptomeria japonica TaxID=3369 RepID=UPI00240894DB|nr:10 kDa chaperonin 1, chloroplastic [Cryptomeria japonica]GLJ11649.1 hypothetical protein SUGI_0173630 [Cryptomeria japonica]